MRSGGGKDGLHTLRRGPLRVLCGAAVRAQHLHELVMQHGVGVAAGCLQEFVQALQVLKQIRAGQGEGREGRARLSRIEEVEEVEEVEEAAP